jgi:type IV secretion system protein VirB1
MRILFRLLLLWSVGTAVEANQLGETGRTRLTRDELVPLIERCAPRIHPNTMLKLLRVESDWRLYVIGLNPCTERNTTDTACIELAKRFKGEKPFLQPSPSNKREAIFAAQQLLEHGAKMGISSIDLGPCQINNVHLSSQFTIENAFEPCTCLGKGRQILDECHGRALAELGKSGPVQQSEQRVLELAISCYSSGKVRGFFNHGYVSKVKAASINPK